MTACLPEAAGIAAIHWSTVFRVNPRCAKPRGRSSHCEIIRTSRKSKKVWIGSKQVGAGSRAPVL